MGKYAKGTMVSVDKSIGELRGLLYKYGASGFQFTEMVGGQFTGSEIKFMYEYRLIKLTMPLPDKDSREFTHTPERGTHRGKNAIFRLWEQECRARWQALVKFIQMTLEAIDNGVITFDQAFFPFMVLPDGDTTVFQAAAPQIVEAFNSGRMPKLLLPGASNESLKGVRVKGRGKG